MKNAKTDQLIIKLEFSANKVTIERLDPCQNDTYILEDKER